MLVKTPSTVAAVEALLSDEEEGYSSAAIASGVCEKLFDGIQVLYKGIQDETCESLMLLARLFAAYLLLTSFISPANFTRFYILAQSIDGNLPSASTPFCPWSHPSPQNKGLLRIREPQSRELTFDWRSGNGTRRGGLASLLTAMDLPVCRLDRRPILGAKTFAHVYILEVDDDDQSPSSIDSSPIISDSEMAEDVGAYGGDGTGLQSNMPLSQLKDDGGWVSRLREAAERVVEAGGNAEVLGRW